LGNQIQLPEKAGQHRVAGQTSSVCENQSVDDLASRVLPLIRSRSEVHRWSVANAHGARMHQAVDVLEDALGLEDPKAVFDVTRRAITSAWKVISRADGSSFRLGGSPRRPPTR
jgi:hypothetical protein